MPKGPRSWQRAVMLTAVSLTVWGLGCEGAWAWPTFRNGPQNRGLSPVTLRDKTAMPGATPWHFQTAGLIWGTPVVDDQGNVYVGSADKGFYSLTPDGKERWRYRIFDRPDSLIDSAAALTPTGKVVVPGGDGYLHALDRATGKQLWTFHAYHSDDATHQQGTVVNSFEGNVTVGPDGTIYAGSDNGTMYAIDDSGKEKWHFQTGMMIWSSPAFDPAGKWMAFGSLDSHLYILDPATGKQLTAFRAAGDVKASPTVDDQGRLYVGAADGRFYGFDVRRDPATGAVSLAKAWEAETGAEIYSSAAVAEGRVVVGTLDGRIICWDRQGRPQWTYHTHSKVAGSLAVSADGVVLVGARNGKLYALDLQTGERIWSYRTSDRRLRCNLDSSPSIGRDGRIHVGSYDGRLYTVPAGYVASRPADPRCEYGGHHDVPAHGEGVAADTTGLRLQDPDGNYREAPAGPIGAATPLRLRLASFRGAEPLDDAAFNPGNLKVSITPPVPLETSVSSDGRFLNVRPARFFAPDTRYTLTVEGDYRIKQVNWLIDRFWPRRDGHFRWSMPFATTSASSAALPGLAADATWRLGLKSLYLFQPEALDTYTPAALDGQAFAVTGFAFAPDRRRFLMLALPALPTADGVSLQLEASKAFTLDAAYQRGQVNATGAFSLAAMGGTIPFDRFRVSFGLDGTGTPVDGQFSAAASALGVKGNGQSYTFPAGLMNELCDGNLTIKAEGTFKWTSPPTDDRPSALSATLPSASGLRDVTLRWSDATPPPTGLVSVVLYDPDAVTVLARQTTLVEAAQWLKGSARVDLTGSGWRSTTLPARARLRCFWNTQTVADQAVGGK